jgi:hypothetical protein
MSFVTTKELEIVQAVATHVVSRPEMRAQGGFDRYVKVMLPMEMENLVVSMVDLFAADRIKNTTVSWPADWWEAVKDRWAPTWFRQRYPVRYTRFTVDVKAIWQGYKPATDKYGPFLPYVVTRVDDGGMEC